MSDDRSVERSIRSWLEEGPTMAPDRPVEAALSRIEQTAQEWGPLAPWRLPTMHPLMRFASAAVIAAIAVAGALYVLAGGGGTGDSPMPSRSADSTSSAASIPPSPTSSGSGAPLDTSSWTRYESERYGFTISHPPDWTVRPSTDEWTLGGDFRDTRAEGFLAPESLILVTAWSAEVPAGTTLEAWLRDYCEVTTFPCDDLEEAADPRSTFADGHDGVLIPFRSDVQVFIPTWFDGSGSIWSQPAPADLGRIYVVAAWRPDKSFYDARRLVEAFARSMRIADPAPES